MIPKPKQEWDEHDRRTVQYFFFICRRNVQLNARVVYTLHCAIARNEYNRVCQCKLATKIWRLLEVTHEGTNQVKESKINLLVHSYNFFFIKDNETIVEMITMFTDIVNGLEALRKTYKESEKVIKILRSLSSK